MGKSQKQKKIQKKKFTAVLIEKPLQTLVYNGF
jgi:hypothetical protein